MLYIHVYELLRANSLWGSRGVIKRNSQDMAHLDVHDPLER